MAGYLASRQHEVEPVQAESISYSNHAVAPTGFETYSDDRLIDYCWQPTPLKADGAKEELIRRMKGWR